MHVRPRALAATSTYITFKLPLAGGKVIMFGHHMEARKKAMDDFQQKASVRLAILSITAAGVSSHLYMCHISSCA